MYSLWAIFVAHLLFDLHTVCNLHKGCTPLIYSGGGEATRRILDRLFPQPGKVTCVTENPVADVQADIAACKTIIANNVNSNVDLDKVIAVPNYDVCCFVIFRLESNNNFFLFRTLAT